MTDKTPAMIAIDNVSKWYGQTQVLNKCSAGVSKGEVVVVCGPSGSGKSTLIKCVNGLEPFQEGKILVEGISVGDPKTNLPKLRARIGMVFQNFELFPHLSVIRNLSLAQIKVLGRDEKASIEKGMKLLDRVGLPRTPTNFRDNCRADSSNASLSPARWQWTRSPCCSTSRPRRSIRR